MAGLAVYLDDSGTHMASPVVVAAGYVAEVDSWTAFSRDWQALLADKTDLPVNEHGLRVFHMVDFENSRHDEASPFCGWSTERRADFMASAAALVNRIVADSRGAGIVIGVMPKYLERTVEFDPPMPPYVFALLEAMKRVEAWADHHGRRDTTIYYFDKVPGHVADTIAMMANVERELDLSRRFRFAKWSWVSKARHSELHAADILAYEAWKEANNSGQLPGYDWRTSKAIPVRRSLRAIAQSIHFHTLYDDLELRRWISDIEDAEWLEERRARLGDNKSSEGE